jgi:hypothetical protein
MKKIVCIVVTGQRSTEKPIEEIIILLGFTIEPMNIVMFL